MKKILVLCTGNSCRSQIAEAYLRKFADGKFEVYSAGVEKHGLNPRAVATMAEDGIDISSHTSNNVDEYSDIVFDHVLTVCDHAQEVCPVLPGKHQKHHYSFTDPAKAQGDEESIMKVFSEVREQIKQYSQEFIRKLEA